ncbi:hypothetical protein K9U39_10290 [Rhodoblastus acidophilus]|uniref:Lipoprotein n=1 Tax=Candidatus Rhodoblastus alkanivorans TaxID=2954117 RepID=A0ABS9Z9X8_9HYPH|nr:hypothetical protein [Candidatus Rhodoblastus alkanivorans]MCI4680345.1 hypothetical protein [Candidatus Rhodoblastus alkanivorans]MCI4684002.1 hypothetical protein [Candidatus Rhodoblastus alkanivorans]MDI4641321.1 hypothetical protein [Rhodoblastus acidophilus]
MKPSLRLFFSVSLLLTLGACNANRPAPEVQIPQPPVETAVRVTPRAPTEGGCAAEIARYRGIVDHDAATGNVEASVSTQIHTEIGEAERACTAGDQLRAKYLLRASKERHGYPQG